MRLEVRWNNTQCDEICTLCRNWFEAEIPKVHVVSGSYWNFACLRCVEKHVVVGGDIDQLKRENE